MEQYEYRVVQLPAGGNITHMNERLAHMVSEGWEPFLMSGDTSVNVLVRRRAQQQSAQQSQAGE